jgi:hypothetical protein
MGSVKSESVGEDVIELESNLREETDVRTKSYVERPKVQLPF